MPDNPYSAPADSGPEIVASNDDKPIELASSSETLETLSFNGKLIRGVAVFCGLGSLVYLFSTLMGFYYLEDIMNWSWIHTIQAYRLLFFPSMASLAYFGWKYANAISQVSRTKSLDLEMLSTAQGNFWLIVVFHCFLILCGIGLSFSASYAYSQ